MQLHLSDLQICDIYNLVQDNKTTQFVLLVKILYKKNGNILVLVVSEILGTQTIHECHKRLGFHFSRNQMDSLLRSLIFHPRLGDMISRVVKTCLICTLSAPKRIRTLIGSQSSNYYLPSQCLVVDSAYFPKSSHGYKNVLILEDAATGYVTVYPSQSL